MSDLIPVGTPINIDGVERTILFTLSAIHGLETEFGKTFGEVMETILDKKIEEIGIMEWVEKTLFVLFNDEARRTRQEDKKIPDKDYLEDFITARNISEIISAIFCEYGVDIPEPDEDDPNQTGEQTMN